MRRLPDGTELGFVDVPGHERFLPNMLAGVLSIDRVLLIVAADDGPRPQTLEHLDILELIGVAEITGVVTKIDRVEPSGSTRSRPRSTALLAAAGYAGEPDLPGVEPHRRRHRRARPSICARAPAPPSAPRAATAADRACSGMPIDRAFSLPGIGLVVTGTAAAGEVAVGDRLMVSPRGVAVAGARAPRAEPADRDAPAPASAAPSTSPARFRRAASRGAATG